MKRQPVLLSKIISDPFFQSLEARQLMSITPSLVEVPISAAAIAKDPNLANYKTFDLQVTLDKNERWLSTDAVMSLSKGTVYEAPVADSETPQPNLWNLSPNLQFDTFVSASDFDSPVLLGSFQPTSTEPVFNSTTVNASWGAFQDTGTGTFTVARYTVSSDAVGTVVGQTASTVTLGGPQKQFNFKLGNVPLPSISGQVFSDINGNGKLDSGETGISGVKVYLDKNDNGKFDSGEKYLLTDSKGNYDFNPLTAGQYWVREVLPTNYRRTLPSSGVYSCIVSPGVDGTNKNFGDDNRVNISGTVFGDKDADGKFDTNEIGEAGWTVWIDKDNDGKLDTGETSTVTTSSGAFSFNNLPAGSFHIRILNQTHYKVTTASSQSFSLSGGGVKSGLLFGIRKVS